jgi:type IV secretory pathway TrbL component
VYVGAVGSWHFIYNDVGKGAASAGEWVYRHPAETAGIALGVAAAATGVGAVVEAAGVASAVAAGATIGEASAGTLVLGGTAALTGGAATYLDNGACNAGNTAACFGRDLGLVGTATGVISTLGALGPIAGLWSLETLPDAVFQGLGWFSATFGVGASVFDTTTTAAGASPCGS